MSDDLLSSMLPYFGCVIRRTAEGIELTGAGHPEMNAAAITPRTFRAPFTLRVVGKTDSTNLRLYWHVGEIILNWEYSVRQLRVHDPATAEQTGVPHRGFIEAGVWHDIQWIVRADGMRLLVDGDERYACDGSYAEIEAPIGVGPCFGSTVVVRDIAVTAP